MTKLKVAEIFESISGEVGMFPQGSPVTFLRLAGCNLQCPWCDTKWANENDFGTEMTVDEVIKAVGKFHWGSILITGGEPLVQKVQVQELVYRLKTLGYRIQMETNGSIRVDDVQMVDCWVIDYKGEDSMGEAFYEFNPGILSSKVWIKYLVGSPSDLEKAISMARIFLKDKIESRFAISPIEGKVSYLECLSAVLKSKLPILLNMQIHKKMGVR